MTNRKAFVLLSGGLDSTTCLHKAVMDYFPSDPGMNLAYGDKDLIIEGLRNGQPGDLNIPWVKAFSVDYGQRHEKEMIYAQDTCRRLGIEHEVLDVGRLLSGRSVMLSRDSVGAVAVPDISYSDIKGVSPTYVPFRNGLLLSAITAQAQKWVNECIANVLKMGDARTVGEEGKRIMMPFTQETATEFMKDSAGIYFGAHADDASNWAYPDCTPEFIGSFANAIYVGTYFCIRLYAPLMWLDKAETVTLGTKLGVDFANTWSCYKGEEFHCGTCPTCRSRKDAFITAGVSDPTQYAA
jgi:7-cyano-7-deazaguanine synthase